MEKRCFPYFKRLLQTSISNILKNCSVLGPCAAVCSQTSAQNRMQTLIFFFAVLRSWTGTSARTCVTLQSEPCEPDFEQHFQTRFRGLTQQPRKHTPVLSICRLARTQTDTRRAHLQMRRPEKIAGDEQRNREAACLQENLSFVAESKTVG